jgi:hypothetical protein
VKQKKKNRIPFKTKENVKLDKKENLKKQLNLQKHLLLGDQRNIKLIFKKKSIKKIETNPNYPLQKYFSKNYKTIWINMILKTRKMMIIINF